MVPSGHMEPPSAGRLERALSWAILAGLMGWLAVTWAPAFGLPLGDSHEGRILSEFGMRVSNFWDKGLLGSAWGGDWSPFSDTPYNHHPPLLHTLHLFVSWVFGEGFAQLKSIGYLSGLASVPALAYMGRRIGLRHLTSTVATALVVVTPFFWLYARLGLGMLPLALLIGTVLHLGRTDQPSRRLVVATAVAAFFAVSSSWQGLVLGAVMGLWLLGARGLDRPTWTVGLTMVAAALVVVGWTLTGPGIGELTEHAGNRVAFPWTVREFLDRQWFFADALTPDGFGWLMVLTLPVGLVHRRTRFVTWTVVLVIVAFMFGPSDNAWIHDYWNFYGFLAVLASAGITLDVLADRLPGRHARAGLLVVALVVAALWATQIERDTFHQRYFANAADAGALLLDVPPAEGQGTGWHLDPIPWTTWMSFHWDLPTDELGVDMVDVVPPGDLVLGRLDRLPHWLDPTVAEAAVAVDGRYALFRAADLADARLTTEADQ